MSKRLWVTKDIVEELAYRKNLSTVYGLAKFLGVDQGTVTGWKRGFRIMSDEHAEKVATHIDEDAAWLALCLAVERVKSDMLADRMRAVLLANANRVALLVIAITALPACLNIHYAHSGPVTGRFRPSAQPAARHPCDTRRPSAKDSPEARFKTGSL